MSEPTAWPAPVTPGPTNSLVDVAGLRVGHHSHVGDGWLTGSTLVLAPPAGAYGGVDVRGGGPGTRETDLLDPRNGVERVQAVLLTGGSAFGLSAADGVMARLFEAGAGVPVGGPGEVVPIVPAAVIFDLPVGGWACRPTAEFGYAAAASAGVDFAVGTVGAGVGARAGVLKGGVGTASVVLDGGVTVGAIVVVNSAGEAFDTATGLPWMAGYRREFGLVDPPADQIAAYASRHRELSPLNTTIAVVATDAALSPAGCRRVAVAAHDGLARALRPCHTPLDGDTVFALATGAVEVPPDPTTPASMSLEVPLMTAIGAAAADCLARAVILGVLAADGAAGIPTYRDLLPGAFG